LSRKSPGRDRRRGRHKRRRSPETKRWEADYLPPPQPPWMAAEVWAKLNALRRELEA